MVVHMVLFNFKEEIDIEKRQEVLRDCRRVIPTLPGVKNLFVGKNIREDGEYEYALNMMFDSIEALDRYRVDPDHARFRDEELYPYLKNVIGLDYEE